MRRGLILWFLLIYYCALGQDYFSNLRKISVEEGLSHYKVLSFLPEEDGMWIGTENGLNYYDGYQWKYWTQDAGQLTNEGVNFIYKDQANRLWLFNTRTKVRPSTVMSIDILNAQRDSIFSFDQLIGQEAPFSIEEIRHFFVDHQAFFYFYTERQCWQYAPGTGFKPISFPNGFVPNRRFPNGKFVGFQDHRLLIIDENQKVVYESEALIESIDYSIKGTAQKFWLDHHESTCLIFEQKPQGGYRVKPFLAEAQTHLFELMHYDEEKEQLWLTQEKGLYLFNNREQLIYKREDIHPR
ncbi:MAG: hypothetical protein AAF985_14120, partial [Bacteroidota bacterium]